MGANNHQVTASVSVFSEEKHVEVCVNQCRTLSAGLTLRKKIESESELIFVEE